MANLTFDQKNAKQLLADTFASYGLTDPAFVDAIQKAILDNTDAAGNVATSTATAQIRQTDQYKIRFSGNEMRRKAIQDAMARGETTTMSELSEARYIELEDSYREVLKKANVPAQFYSSTTYLAKMIGNDLSTGEVAARASLAKQAASQANPEIKQQLQSLYGISENQVAAFFLDPNKMEGEITKKAQAAELAAQARSAANIQLTGAEAEQIIGRGITATDQTRQALSALGAATGITSLNISEMIAGEEAISGSEAVAGILGANAAAQQRIQTRTRRRQAEFEAGGSFAGTQAGTTGLGTAQQ